MKHYHYIFAGAGLSSLMTVYRMVRSGGFSGKSILLLDHDSKKANDRTWCFWEKGKGDWDDIVFKKWDSALFLAADFTKDLDFGKYQYKMVRGIDFYNYILNGLKEHPEVEFKQQKVIDFTDTTGNVLVTTDTESYTCNKLFNSIYNPSQLAAQQKYPVLQQHFVGWHIKTKQPAFDEEKATFMDFSVPQKGNTRFMYVLPAAPDEALVEYTLFSKNLLPEQEYGAAIVAYLEKHGIQDYEVLYTEKGSIPMTAYPFWKNNSKNILNIGTAGGWTKASTGYTFMNAARKSGELVNFLAQHDDFRRFPKKNRFWFYDLLLLDILDRKNEKGAAIFSSMFKAGKAELIFKFLDEKTTLGEDLQVILKCPKRLFIKALFRSFRYL
jgi:lycopene beta-cyclase